MCSRHGAGYRGAGYWGAGFLAAAFAAFAALPFFLSNINPAGASEAAAEKPLPVETQSHLQAVKVPASAPVYFRIFKEESEFEVWKARADGRYINIKTFPICKWSGALGPKQSAGDQMAPEGFYSFGPDGLRPNSKFHLALNIGYPNALDRALSRNGDFIMVHGDCKSVGCFAMTDGYIEEIYAFARDAFQSGESAVPVHIFPFRMTHANMKRHEGHAAWPSWVPLQEAYNDFARSNEPPRIGACGKRYVVNPIVPLSGNPAATCPALVGKLVSPLSPLKAKKLAKVNVPIVAEGTKTRTAADIANWTPPSALGGPLSFFTSPIKSPSEPPPPALGGFNSH